MKIANFEIDRKNSIIIASIAAAVAVAVLYIMVFRPLLKTVRVCYSECRTLEFKIEDAHCLIESVGKVLGDRVLMTEKESSLAIDEMTKRGNSMEINFTSIVPRDIIADPGGQYKIMPIDVEMEAKADKLIEFMGSMDDLRRGIVRTKSFIIEPDKDDNSKLKARFSAEAYLSARD